MYNSHCSVIISWPLEFVMANKAPARSDLVMEILVVFRQIVLLRSSKKPFCLPNGSLSCDTLVFFFQHHIS